MIIFLTDTVTDTSIETDLVLTKNCMYMISAARIADIIAAGAKKDKGAAYDQCCENCRYYCGWGEERQRGCKLYTRDDYERFPKTRWCYQWKGKKQSYRKRYDEEYRERCGEC